MTGMLYVEFFVVPYMLLQIDLVRLRRPADFMRVAILGNYPGGCWRSLNLRKHDMISGNRRCVLTDDEM
jgi:hypothetical protein